MADVLMAVLFVILVGSLFILILEHDDLQALKAWVRRKVRALMGRST